MQLGYIIDQNAKYPTMISYPVPQPSAHLLGRVNNAGRNDVAAHDAAKDVDQDSLHLAVACEDLEGSHHLYRGRGRRQRCYLAGLPNLATLHCTARGAMEGSGMLPPNSGAGQGGVYDKDKDAATTPASQL